MNDEQIKNDFTMLFVKLDEMSAKLDALLVPKAKQQNLTQPLERKMWPAVCDICKQNCQVPFKPGQGSRIKCMDCYLRQKNGQ